MPIPDTYLWILIGALAGWGAGTLLGTEGKVQRIEELLVGMFGAFSAAELWLAVSGPRAAGFSLSAMFAAIAGAAVLLFVLRSFRSVTRSKPHRRRPGH